MSAIHSQLSPADLKQLEYMPTQGWINSHAKEIAKELLKDLLSSIHNTIGVRVIPHGEMVQADRRALAYYIFGDSSMETKYNGVDLDYQRFGIKTGLQYLQEFFPTVGFTLIYKNLTGGSHLLAIKRL
jgi:hypothetical protein